MAWRHPSPRHPANSHPLLALHLPAALMQLGIGLEYDLWLPPDFARWEGGGRGPGGGGSSMALVLHARLRLKRMFAARLHLITTSSHPLPQPDRQLPIPNSHREYFAFAPTYSTVPLRTETAAVQQLARAAMRGYTEVRKRARLQEPGARRACRGVVAPPRPRLTSPQPGQTSHRHPRHHRRPPAPPPLTHTHAHARVFAALR